MSLLKQVLGILQNHNKSVREVLWIGTLNGEYAISFEEFAMLAESIGWLDNNINFYLVIVGKDWFIDRIYDEDFKQDFWRFIKMPKKDKKSKRLTTLKEI